jgi:hypothetical protein
VILGAEVPVDPDEAGLIVAGRRHGLAGLEWAGVTACYDTVELLIGDQIGMDYQTGMEYQLLGLAWYQVSGGQLRRAGGPPPGAIRLPGGRFELAVGDASQWMPGTPARGIVEAQASRLLHGDT